MEKKLEEVEKDYGRHRMQRVSGILCNRRISVRVNGKVDKIVVRPAREEVERGGNEDVNMDAWSHQAGQN